MRRNTVQTNETMITELPSEILSRGRLAVERTQAFYDRLALEYADLYESNPDYAGVKDRITSESLARKMTLGLGCGTANKDGEGIRRTCKHFKIAHTYKAIRSFMEGL